MIDEEKNQTILVIRLSAMGDVAMTVPVLHSLKKQHPNLNIIMLTTYGNDPMFDHLPGVHLVHFDRHGKHKGLSGVFRVWWKLRRNYSIDYIADLHNVIRSRLLTALFRLTSPHMKIRHVDKERKERRKLVLLGHKKYGHPLSSSFERYRRVFESLGIRFDFDFKTIFSRKTPDLEEDMLEYFGPKENKRWVGVAPFAGHRSKIYPMKRMERFLELLNQQENIEIFLFGHGNERPKINDWENKFKNVHSMPRGTYLPQELELMAHLDVMVSMDSANMHLASLVNTPVVSIWGATHRYAGFLGWGQKEENVVELPLDCRPCSIYGERHCPKGTYECMRDIDPQTIVDKVLQQLSSLN
ncbi:MAG: glycosyltransferase family 9 protein [Paludibacteraceae bacterium]|nr:glycosyltransferase family 9 protein [Paludibacteraceae bacterium]